MSASISVVVSTNVPPAVVVNVSNATTYQQFKQSLGNFVYYVKSLYLNSNNLEQIQGTFSYAKYDISGNQRNLSVASALDPYQSQNSIYLDVSKQELIIDGTNYVQFKLLAQSSLSIKLFASRIANQSPLNETGVDNFTALEEASGRSEFFSEYTDYL
jgi:hypothetical protein